MPDCRLALGGNGWSPCAANYQKRLGRWVEVGGSAGIACHHLRVDAVQSTMDCLQRVRLYVPVCVVPEPGAFSASQELPSRYDAPNTCTVHVVMHSQLRWRARAHGADGQRSGCDVWEACATFGGSV